MMMADRDSSRNTHINRDILECKCCLVNNSFFTYIILIETYWNVNAFSVPFSSAFVHYINRDILECK